MQKKTLKNDILLISALLLLALAAWGVLRLTRDAGNEAVVTVDGQIVLTVPLSREVTLTVGEDLGFRNVVEVAGGRVLVKPLENGDVAVGFVNVVQSKELIMTADVPYIVARGRKGGSSIAAAICNALLYMLDDKKGFKK